MERTTDRLGPIVDGLAEKVICYRRDWHKYAESGWFEFRTASLVARRLADLGYDVEVGRQVLCAEERMGLPAPELLEERWHRAREQGGDPEYLADLRGGFTGVVGTLAGRAGPVVGLRFDMDALDLRESHGEDHRPMRDGFVSANEEAAHACGHDGHTAIGLGLAEVLPALAGAPGRASEAGLPGTVKLIFQPAEEGVRGARAMVAAGVVDDVDYLIGLHLYSGWPVGEVDPGRGGFLATSKFDATLTGAPAHAAGRPHEGRNALLAAATAVLNLHAIARHGDGVTRINVGRLTAGTARNVVCAEAHLAIETRGATTELNDYVYDRAVRILDAAAAMHGCTLSLRAMGSAASAESDPGLRELVERVAVEQGGFGIRPPEPAGGSEDFTAMMHRVQERGGLATNIGLGADMGGWGHHTARFDFDERALRDGLWLLSAVVMEILGMED